MKQIRVKDRERLLVQRGDALTPPGYCPDLLAVEKHQKLTLKNPENNKPTAFPFTSSTSYWRL